MSGKLLNVKDLRVLLGLSERTIFRLIKSGDLQGFRVGREWRFEESDIQDFIQKQRQRARQAREEAA